MMAIAKFPNPGRFSRDDRRPPLLWPGGIRVSDGSFLRRYALDNRKAHEKLNSRRFQEKVIRRGVWASELDSLLLVELGSLIGKVGSLYDAGNNEAFRIGRAQEALETMGTLFERASLGHGARRL